VKPAETFWTGKKVLVTGGASFIGSTLTDQLLARGAKVRIVDDLTSGHLDNLRQPLTRGEVDFIRADLREPGVTRAAMNGVDTVFHLAADHGGRGYVDLHQAGPASNFFLDGLIFAEAVRAGVEKVVFASSGCVYPNVLQSDVKKEAYLTEDLTKGLNDADNTYGWAKLMAEFTLKAYHKEHGLGRHPAAISPCTAPAAWKITRSSP
jgi:nucleoside-diphosphate-sugar epimerase